MYLEAVFDLLSYQGNTQFQVKYIPPDLSKDILLQ